MWKYKVYLRPPGAQIGRADRSCWLLAWGSAPARGFQECQKGALVVICLILCLVSYHPKDPVLLIIFLIIYSVTVVSSSCRSGPWLQHSPTLRRGSERGADLFFLASSHRMHRNGSKLWQRRFWLDIRKHFSTEIVCFSLFYFVLRTQGTSSQSTMSLSEAPVSHPSCVGWL